MSEEQVDLGHKRICPLCSAKYYDFHQDELDCPSCGKRIQAVNINKPKRGRRAGIINTQTAPVKENDDLKDLIEETSDEDAAAPEENLSEEITIDIAANKEPEAN